MSLTNLRYFREIVRLSSMTAAARALGVSQPRLSQAVRSLEEQFGTTLLLRHRGGVSPTQTGSELLRHIDEVFAVLDRATARIAGLEDDLVGRFVLGCHESLGAYFLPLFMPGLLRDAPSITVTLRNESSAHIRQAVIDREVHFGLIVNPEPHPDLVMTRLFHDAVDFFVCARDPVVSNQLDPGVVGSPEFYADDRCATLDIATAHDRLRRGPLIFAGRVEQCAELLGLLAEQRAAEQRMSDRVQLVWSPPELDHVDARDTVVVVQDLFRAAKKNILIVSYVLDAGKKAETLFGELAARMDDDPDLAVRIFVNIPRKRYDNTPSTKLIDEFAARVRDEVWPGERLPDFFYDPRSLAISSHQGASLHAKCVVTDGRWTLLTSANFTEAAQERNIEAGVLLDDPTFAQRVTRQFDLLVEDETLQRLDVGVKE